MEKKTKTKDQVDKDEVVLKAKLIRWWGELSTSRKNKDWQWFKYDLWVNGLHYAKWDKNTQQIVSTNPNSGQAKVTINKVYTTLRGVRNYVLRNRPKAETTPYNLTPENINEAVKINQYLDYMHDKLKLRTKLRGTMWQALKYSVGFWQILWDEDEDEGVGEIVANQVDPYDLYYDALEIEDSTRIILAVKRNIVDLKDDPKYKGFDWSKIKAENKQAASNLKERIIQYEKGSQTNNSEKGEGSVILREYWYKNDDKIMICAMVGDEIVRKPEDTGLNRFPFFKLASDIDPMAQYGQGWVKNLIPANKLLNMLESSLAEYNNILNKGKYVADKGAGVNVINSENGQIIEKKHGFEVSQMPIAPLSAAIYTQIENANRYIEDIGALHDASMGRIPNGANSGKAIEALQVGDSNNLSELIENTEEFLENVYEYILYLASQKYQFARNITVTRNTGQKEFLKVIGEGAGNQPEGATVLPTKNMIDVKITSWLANTAEARREVLKELYQMQVIDQETLLEGYSIGNIADIIKKVREQKAQEAAGQLAMQQKQQEIQTQGQQQAAQATTQAQNQATASTLPGKQQAIGVIRQILNDQIPQIPPMVGQDFVDYLNEFLQGQEAQGLDPEQIKAIERAREQAIQAVGQAPVATSSGQGPAAATPNPVPTTPPTPEAIQGQPIPEMMQNMQ